MWSSLNSGPWRPTRTVSMERSGGKETETRCKQPLAREEAQQGGERLTLLGAGAVPTGHLLPEGPAEERAAHQGLPLGLDVLEQLVQDVTWAAGGAADQAAWALPHSLQPPAPWGHVPHRLRADGDGRGDRATDGRGQCSAGQTPACGSEINRQMESFAAGQLGLEPPGKHLRKEGQAASVLGVSMTIQPTPLHHPPGPTWASRGLEKAREFPDLSQARGAGSRPW